MQLSFSALLDYLQSLGTRRLAIGRARLGFEGAGEYPVLVVEPDPLCSEVRTGLLSYDLAFLVLNREQDPNGEYRPDPSQVPALLAQTGQWADEIIEQLRQENIGDVVPGSVGRVALTDFGPQLATGWRVELKLQVAQQLDRRTNAALFDAALPQPPESRPLNEWTVADIIAGYTQLAELRGATNTLPFKLA